MEEGAERGRILASFFRTFPSPSLFPQPQKIIPTTWNSHTWTRGGEFTLHKRIPRRMA